MLFQNVGHDADFAVKLQVGQRHDIARLALENEGRLVAHRAFQMPVEAVDAGVILPPTTFRERWFPDADFFHLRNQRSSSRPCPKICRVFLREALYILRYFFMLPIRAAAANFATA